MRFETSQLNIWLLGDNMEAIMIPSDRIDELVLPKTFDANKINTGKLLVDDYGIVKVKIANFNLQMHLNSR